MGTSSILAWGKSRVGLPINTPRGKSCWWSKCSWSLCTCLWSFTFWQSHDSICSFRISSSLIAGACKIRNWTRQTSRRAQVKQLKLEKLSPCLSGNLKDSNACAYTTLSWPLPTSKVLFLETPKTSTLLILLQEINNFLQNRQWGLCSISRCFQMEQNTTHFPLIFPHVKLIGR